MTTLDRQEAFSGTRDVAPALRFEPLRLEAYLAANVPGFAGPLAVRQFKGGQSNPTYLLETPARRYVLRRKPPGKLLPSAHAVDREFRVIGALHAQGFPVARAGALLRRRERGRHRVLRHGPCRRARLLGAAHAGRRRGRAQCGLRRHERDIARLHAFDPAAIGLADSAAARITWAARSSAGRSSTAPRRRRRSTKWRG